MPQLVLVEDSRELRNLLSNFLRANNISCLIAKSAEQALSIMSQETKIRIVLTDLRLPGMDGLSLCRKLRRKDPLLVMIAMTGYPSFFSLLECREAGFDDYFVKPLRLNVVLEVLQRSIKQVNRWRDISTGK